MSDVDALIRIKNRICPPYLRVFLKRSLRAEFNFAIQTCPHFFFIYFRSASTPDKSRLLVSSTRVDYQFPLYFYLTDCACLEGVDGCSESWKKKIAHPIWWCFWAFLSELSSISPFVFLSNFFFNFLKIVISAGTPKLIKN